MIGCVFAKVSYATEAAAVLALRQIRRKPTRRDVPARVYKCGACGSWHLTKQTSRARRQRKGKW